MRYSLGMCLLAPASVSLCLSGFLKPAPAVPFISLPTGPRYVSYYDHKTQGMGQYRVPLFAQVKQYRFIDRGGTFTAELVLAGALPKRTRDRITFEVYFSKPGSLGVFDVGLVAPLGAYTYPSTPPLPPASAALVDTGTGRKIAAGRLTVGGDRVTIACASSAIGGRQAALGLVRYAPQLLDNTRVSYGNECVAQEFHSASELKEYKIGLPSHPYKP